jgi:hypothetical protein
MVKSTLCKWCGKDQKWRQNLPKHEKRCIFGTLGATKTHVEMLLSENPDVSQGKVKKLESKIRHLEEVNLQVIHSLNKLYQLIKELKDKYVLSVPKDAIQIINEMLIKDSTKLNYLSEWSQFIKWKGEKEGLSIGLVNSYLGSLESKKPSTIVQKRSILQKILRYMIGENVTLNKMALRFEIKRKYEMSQEEVEAYLEEQQKLNFELFVIQFLMIKFALRVSSASALKLQNLEFLTKSKHSYDDYISIPIVKGNTTMRIKCDEETKSILKKYVTKENITNGSSYLFNRQGADKLLRNRTHDICVAINACIKDSKVLSPKNPNFVYSSHMFRRTKLNLEIAKDKEAIRLKGNRILGQKPGSRAVDSYMIIDED